MELITPVSVVILRLESLIDIDNTSTAVSVDTISWFTGNIESHYKDDAEALAEATSGTAMSLFPRFLKAENQ